MPKKKGIIENVMDTVGLGDDDHKSSSHKSSRGRKGGRSSTTKGKTSNRKSK